MSKQSLEDEVQGWRNFSLGLLLLLGVVGAISYTLLIRQKDRLELQESRIFQLTDKVNSLSKDLDLAGSNAVKK